ncbi:aminotransferase-like domain-containing protein [Albibacillus kandeliae]|uniref:aminotransferase-like domain-containing protein n=1 Tax=Albibacillus kandeliae TaxID=2174228 RepID=UPI000D6858E8|nr:PLP-dependent aminotransferase family protein [Albibacillus kandeliae]
MSKVDKIVEDLAADIAGGILPPGQRLPSIRRAAEDFSVSKNTIVEAYDRLTSKGLVRAVHGSGFYVAELGTEVGQATPQPQHMVEAFDQVSLLNAQLNQDLQVRVGDGRPPLSWMQDALPQKLSGNFLQRFEGDQTAYGSAFGNIALRELIAQKYRREGMQASAEQVVTTFGANHALDLIIRRYLEPGDTVLVDEPGYYPLFAKLKFNKINYIGVSRTVTGPDLDQLRNLARLHRPKIFFTQSRCQNPTGSAMDLPTAHGVLQAATSYGMRIVDSDPFVDLPDQRGTPLALMDQFDNVIAISSYSKLLSASFRVGYMIAAPQIAREIAELKLVTVVNSSRFSEMLTCDMITNRRYLRHLKKTAQRLKERRDDFRARVEAMGLSVFDPEGGGYYSFLQLPEGSDEAQIARRALAKGIFLASGKFFYVNQQSRLPSFRINLTRSDDPRFYSFLKKEVASAA